VVRARACRLGWPQQFPKCTDLKKASNILPNVLQLLLRRLIGHKTTFLNGNWNRHCPWQLVLVLSSFFQDGTCCITTDQICGPATAATSCGTALL
jgi:hypothetical protein